MSLLHMCQPCQLNYSSAPELSAATCGTPVVQTIPTRRTLFPFINDCSIRVCVCVWKLVYTAVDRICPQRQNKTKQKKRLTQQSTVFVWTAITGWRWNVGGESSKKRKNKRPESKRSAKSVRCNYAERTVNDRQLSWQPAQQPWPAGPFSNGNSKKWVRLYSQWLIDRFE